MAISIFLAILLTVFLSLKLWLRYCIGVCHSKNSMEGKVIIVTGGNSGIGFETAKDLAARKGRVILACRSLDRGRRAAKIISQETGNREVIVRKLDLSSLDSVRDFAAEILTTEDRLDVIIHNAGMSAEPGQPLTKDNLDPRFATNHFGPFLLTHLLLDLLKKSTPSRIIVLSSVAHHFAELDLDNIYPGKSRKGRFWDYCDTKLANILFVKELAKRLEGTGVTVNALHPGTVRTNIVLNVKWYIRYPVLLVFYYLLRDAKSGAQTSIYLAVADEVANVSGKYFADCKPALTSVKAMDEEKAIKLWKLSEHLTGIS